MTHLARRTGVLPIIERARYMVDAVRAMPVNSRVRAAHPGEGFPPSWLAYDAYQSCRFDRYLARGRGAAAEIHEIITALCAPGRTPLRIFEWGCGPGRIMRHLRRPGLELSGSDANAASVAWCQRELPDVHVVANDPRPPLPFPSASFDFIYAISVLTHLSAASQQAWIAELLRVLRPGGYLLVTVHGAATAHVLSAAERSTFHAAGIVERSRVAEGSRLFCTYNSPTYMRETLLPGLPLVLERVGTPSGVGTQHLYVVQRPH